MDIANYVGLFLLKNEYCFLPGIGSLQIEKRPAVYDKETKQMSAPSYDVFFRPEGGSIDDSFANFIANNERISIAHAANHLKDFCARAKVELKEGKSIPIPAIGSFESVNNVIRFVKLDSLQIVGKSIPYFKNSDSVTAKKEEALSNIIERTNIREPKANEEIEYKAPSVNWGKIIALAAIVVVVVAGGIFLFMSLNKDKQDAAAETPVVDTVAQAPPVAAAPVDSVPASVDTAKVDSNSTAAPAVGADGMMQYKVVLNAYPTRERAASRVAKLKSYGLAAAELIAKDSTNYYVALPVSSAASDTAKVVDSLRKLYNPSGTLQIIR